jgi:RNA polymerase sigma factor (TIGR02999 family)
MPSPDEITQLLHAFGDGDSEAVEHLVPMVYDALRGIAHNHLAHERPDHTFSTTALVHEAYIKLIDQREATWKSRAHFFAIASQAMRRILVDYARRRKAAKRGGDAPKVPLEEALVMAETRADELLALDEALSELAAFDPRQAAIVEYRFFGGLTIEQTGAVMDISPSTVKREWIVAKAWLSHAMDQPGP